MNQGQLKLYNNFIIKSIETHGDKYNYSKVFYTTNKTKVQIYCPLHEHTFWTEPKRHYIENKGCEYCSGYKSNTKLFIDDCVKVHGGNYNYEHVVYLNKHSKITIKCNICKSIFTQKAEAHRYHKQGCPTCHKNKLYEISVKNKTDFQIYKHIVEKMTEKTYRLNKSTINPNNYKRGHIEYHIDHKYSISEGFKNNIPPYIISSLGNLQLIRYDDNIRKSRSCSISIEDIIVTEN